MKPICVKCQRFYRPKKNGFYFIEGMPEGTLELGRPIEPGTVEPERWKPYKLWVGDLWECRGCGHQTIAGVSHRPLREHYEPDFAEQVKRLGATYQVNDC